MALEFYLFLLQVNMTPEDVLERARAAEAAGFVGMVGMDHLMPSPEDVRPTFDAMLLNTWIAARTERLRVGSLVQCNSFRHPGMLARETVSLDHLSSGRFDLGIGWGSRMSEFEAFGIEPTDPRLRRERLRETLEIMKALWSGEVIDYVGKHFTLRNAQLLPRPLGRIPILIGGEGKKTLELVAAHGDWWNLHLHMLDHLEERREWAGNAWISVQFPVIFIPSEDRRASLIAAAPPVRPPHAPIVGNASELVQHFGDMAARGVERIYLWFWDGTTPDKIAAFSERVIAQL